MKKLLNAAVLGLALLAASVGYAADKKPLQVDAGKIRPFQTGDTVPVANGGTGATSASAARTGLGLGTFATQDYATPPAIGGTTPAAGAFSTLSASGNLTTNVTGSTQCLHANSSGVVSGTGSDCGAGGGSAITAKDEGSTLTAAVTSFDCVGAGIVCTNTSGAVTMTVSGGGGGGSIGGATGSVDNAIIRADGTGGTTIQAGSLITIDDTGALGLPDGVRQTFNPNATNAGINVGSQAGNPSSPSNGDLWNNSSTNALMARVNGSTVELGSFSGSWTPVLTFGGGSTGITYTDQLGQYVRIGKLVFCTMSVQLSNKGSSTGNAAIGGLPFAANTTSHMYQLIPGISNVGITTWLGLVAQAAGVSSTSFGIYTSTTAAVTNTSFTNTTQMVTTFTYMTD